MNRILWTAAACLVLAAAAASAGPAAPQPGEKLPAFVLPVPANADHQGYLGLASDGEFAIPQIDAEIVIIEIFSMYCPHCQREAPHINAFYRKLESDAVLRDKVKLIGIGAGNSAFEVAHFRKTYAIPFPLFADADFVVHRKIGEVRTPYFIGIRNTGQGEHEVFFSRLGGAEDAVAILEALIEQAAIK
jgi:thiol-disulfide isomerase/thioredoxin